MRDFFRGPCGDENKQNWRGVAIDPHKVPKIHTTLEYDNKIVYSFLKLKTDEQREKLRTLAFFFILV